MHTSTFYNTPVGTYHFGNNKAWARKMVVILGISVQTFHGDTCLFLDVYISIKVGTEEYESEMWVYVIHNYYE